MMRECKDADLLIITNTSISCEFREPTYLKKKKMLIISLQCKDTVMSLVCFCFIYCLWFQADQQN